MFETDGAKLLEIIVRVAVVYVACIVLLRVSGRREMSKLGPMDLLTMLLISETVSPALTGGDQSVTGGVIAAAVLLGLAVLTSWLSLRNTRFEKLVQGGAMVLIRDGQVSPTVLARYRITDDDLRNALHAHGLLHTGDVARAYVEAGGEITMIKRSDLEQSRERFHAPRHAPSHG
jgi:uncharacterized membrane protein YcaP (DUF421 family)